MSVVVINLFCFIALYFAIAKSVKSAETGRTLPLLLALVFQLLRLPLLRFRFHAFVALFSVGRRHCRICVGGAGRYQLGTNS